MKKTIDDYLNDPAVLNEPSALREVHAIRLKIQDERKGMTSTQYNNIVHERASRFFAPQQSSHQAAKP